MSAKGWFAFSFIVFVSIRHSHEVLPSSQVLTLLRLKVLLNSPSLLSGLDNRSTDPCNMEPNGGFAVVCYDRSITQLHIVGTNPEFRQPENFSIDSFVTTLVRITSLKVLELVCIGLWGHLPGKISRLSYLEILNLTRNHFEGELPENLLSLSRMQTLILDGNNFTGLLPSGIGSLSSLAVLSVKNNSLHGALPDSLSELHSLRILELSDNEFSGDVPDLRLSDGLQVLDVGNNGLGPHFPSVSDNISKIVLRKNRFTFGIPEGVSSYNQMKTFDVSSNRFVGPFPFAMLSLPSLVYLDISENRFTGRLVEDAECNNGVVEFVNLSANLLTGKLPHCLLASDSTKKAAAVFSGENCLEDDERQLPISYCENEALAVGVLPARPRKLARKTSLVLIICGSVVGGGAVLACAAWFGVGKLSKTRKSMPSFAPERASAGYTSELLQNARYVTETKNLGALGLPTYKTFSLEEIKEATKSSTSLTTEAPSHRQMQLGRLRDGLSVAIRCIDLKKNHSNHQQQLRGYIETISKLRHHHLLSALGHCFEYDEMDDSSLKRVYLVFEHAPNGTLRSWTSGKHEGRNLTWAQRIAAVTGVAKGIQFLHGGIVQGLFENDIKITDIVLDHNMVSKISSFNLSWISDQLTKVHPQNQSTGSKGLTQRTGIKEHRDKSDIYDIGVILLEVISGKAIESRDEAISMRDQFKAAEEGSRRNLVDPAVNSSWSRESIKTMMEICWRCLADDPAERPSIEDVLWNLQFAAQGQEAWRGDSQSSDGSPISPLQS
ncbi:hypothetical protein M569_12232 [Genlisea aurea]|uniref:Protein kinase domain-containing protein n=1 Tax=Genlisea aurea TaxID=192259 RepID=S8C702_9LAMI|nr:hypothetical protein M569_12232 [Genlisea aurea]